MRYKINCLLDPNKVIGECLETAFGLKKNCYIIDTVSKDGFNVIKDFQKTFNGYYKLQKRSPKWYKQYCKLFESQKTNAVLRLSSGGEELFVRFWGQTKG